MASPSGSKTEWQPQSSGLSQAREAGTPPSSQERPRKSRFLGQGPAAAPTSPWDVAGPREWVEAVRRGFLEERQMVKDAAEPSGQDSVSMLAVLATHTKLLQGPLGTVFHERK